MLCTTVVVYCHSNKPMMGKFLFRAQHHNMTNGDFVFFTFLAARSIYTDMPWLIYVRDKNDIPRLMPVFPVVKQVSICDTPLLRCHIVDTLSRVLATNQRSTNCLQNARKIDFIRLRVL